MSDNVKKLEECIRLAPTDEAAEKFVRRVLRRSADSCPTNVLVRLAEYVVRAYKDELKAYDERN